MRWIARRSRWGVEQPSRLQLSFRAFCSRSSLLVLYSYPPLPALCSVLRGFRVSSSLPCSLLLDPALLSFLQRHTLLSPGFSIVFKAENSRRALLNGAEELSWEWGCVLAQGL